MYAAVPSSTPTPVSMAGLVIVGDCDMFTADSRRFHCFREPEVEHLDGAVVAQFDVRGFQIAVDDAVLVRRLQRLGDLFGNRQRLVNAELVLARCDRPT